MADRRLPSNEEALALARRAIGGGPLPPLEHVQLRCDEADVVEIELRFASAPDRSEAAQEAIAALETELLADLDFVPGGVETAWGATGPVGEGEGG